MTEERKKLSIGLFKKSDPNKIEDYIEMAIDPIGISLPEVTKTFQDMVALKLEQMKQNPEQFFNFGFTYNDFKSYLLKLAFCRGMRMFIEKKRLERIAQFQANNNFTIGMNVENPNQLQQ